ncbi:MFS transporter [Rhodohalobacter sp.]|uniref:MFS transporter n=1 Tax=Rhodohalobacter sp. TaxID=1974210 RepID=UPI002ACE6BF4|nr:MFS transporter [Rhodohalobacter sp.]
MEQNTVNTMQVPSRILPVIVFAQFAGTSLWFAGNAVLPDLTELLQLSDAAVGHVTSAVQFGFIGGTLLFAYMSLADRFSPSLVFLICAVAGSAANLLAVFSTGYFTLLLTRFFTGFFLAGIYPVGMKIASDWHREGLGKALGYLVGALVLGTALPHLIRDLSGDLPWKFILISTSGIATFGGVILYVLVPDGPYSSKKGIFKPGTISSLFKDRNFRASAFGYFGHMWELYTFWAFVPVILIIYQSGYGDLSASVSLLSFIIIGIGSIGCAVGGHFAIKKSSQFVTKVSLYISGLFCLLIPFLFHLNEVLFLSLLVIWGIFVVSDSPQFSTMVARSSDKDYVATGLTIVNSIGFATTIVSLQLLNILWVQFQSTLVFLALLPGPVLGLLAIYRYRS